MAPYFSLITKYFPQAEPTFEFYIVHAVLVTNKALKIARNLKLSNSSLSFIENASMLHDIGICRVNYPEVFCFNSEPYIKHGVYGREILEKEGFTKEALVAERHIGVGISVADIKEQNLPLPERDMRPQTIEEEIITYADLFFSKNPKRLWQERTFGEVQEKTAEYAKEHLSILLNWQKRFELSKNL